MNKTTPFAFYTLLLAALYNLIWGGAVVLFPNETLQAFGLNDVKYVQLWQCIGMIVGVYGLGYGIAAVDSNRHWPIVLVGFLGKIFGPIGFAQNLYLGVFPPAFGINIIFNDLIWWIPFYIVLKQAWKFHQTDERVAKDITTNFKEDDKNLVLLTRHLGCTFTRELIIDLAKVWTPELASKKNLVIVHMGENDEIKEYLKKYIDEDLVEKMSFYSDPNQEIYKFFDVRKGKSLELFGLQEFTRGFSAALKGAGLGPLRGDGTQLGGMFLYQGKKVVKSFHCKRASSSYPLSDFILE